jgi:hypothetical protein
MSLADQAARTARRLGMAPTAAAAAVTPDPGVFYEIWPPYVNPAHHKCLDVPGGTSAVGTHLQNGLDLVNEAAGMCMAVTNNSGQDHTAVGLMPCYDSTVLTNDDQLLDWEPG